MSEDENGGAEHEVFDEAAVSKGLEFVAEAQSGGGMALAILINGSGEVRIIANRNIQDVGMAKLLTLLLLHVQNSGVECVGQVESKKPSVN